MRLLFDLFCTMENENVFILPTFLQPLNTHLKFYVLYNLFALLLIRAVRMVIISLIFDQITLFPEEILSDVTPIIDLNFLRNIH